MPSEMPVSGVKALKMLLDKACELDLKLWALNAPFETKDKLRERGYRWNNERRIWCRVISNESLAQETDWLRAEVYGNRSFQLEQETMDAYNRFSTRSGVAEKVDY